MRRTILARPVVALAAALFCGPVAAQVTCGEQPRDVPLEVQEELRGDVQGKAQLFTRLLGDAQLQGQLDATRRELNEKHRNIDQSQLDRYMLWTTCQAILADRTLTPHEKVDQYLRVYKALRPGSSQSEPPRYPHMIVTATLGLQFRQDNEIAPITRTPEDIMVVRLKRTAFEIMLPGRLTQDIDNEAIALEITLAREPALLRLASAKSQDASGPFFQAGNGMADYEHGSGELFGSDSDPKEPGNLPFNYIIGDRFNVESEGRRGVYVSTLPVVSIGYERYEDPPDILRVAPAAYLVCRLEAVPGKRTRVKVDPLEAELIRIDFAD